MKAKQFRCILQLTFAPAWICRKGDESRYWSLMFEISESAEHKPVDLATIVEETIQGAVNVRLMRPEDEIVSIYHRRIEKGYARKHHRNASHRSPFCGRSTKKTMRTNSAQLRHCTFQSD